jgi:hypothetical protein
LAISVLDDPGLHPEHQSALRDIFVSKSTDHVPKADIMVVVDPGPPERSPIQIGDPLSEDRYPPNPQLGQCYGTTIVTENEMAELLRAPEDLTIRPGLIDIRIGETRQYGMPFGFADRIDIGGITSI